MPTLVKKRRRRRSRSCKKLSRSKRDKCMIAKKQKMYRLIRKKYGSKKCPMGKVMREGYRRKNKQGRYVVVKPTCIRDVGKPGKGKQLFVLEKDVLKKYGYTNIKSLTVEQRQKALKKAVTDYEKPLPIFRRLVAISTLNKNTNPRLSRMLKRDAKWVKERYMNG